ncbi:hypothetical protein [Flavisolibacter nicotianae]|uniref:hypothetical protein n=1 Tax=Flavisolibacter nicotianae TaxID=2364882 RepID=UPI000EAC273F|nr:hypothetical protein [Flavisolibacter nicotianae]
MAKQLAFLLFLSTVFFSASSQALDSLVDLQHKADPQEKVYVQFDKSYYNPGETIWYKAYFFTGNEPADVSRNFYAELIDFQGNVLQQKVAPIRFSGAAGSFDLDSNFRKAAIYFRGYTISELNSDTAFLFTKALRVLSPKAAATNTPLSQTKPVLRFLPEGGDLTNGLPTVVAFIAASQAGGPVTVTGSVADNTGIKVAELVTLHDGMGRFVLMPQEGKTYTATWKTSDGKTFQTPLPAAQPQGVALRITDAAAGKRFTIQRTAQVPEAKQQLHLVAMINQRLAFQANVDLRNKDAASGVFPTKDLSSGILVITLFDSNNKPLAERISFVNNHDYEFDGDVFLSQKGLARRQLNRVEVIMSDTLPANLSLSITDADLHETNRLDDNIISRMLLTGELRGKINDPYYYFYSNDDSVSVYLDLVMMTHGWRRYNWDNVFAATLPVPRWKESNYLSLKGQVAGMPPGSYSPDLQLTGILETADSAKTIINLPIDRKGNVFTEGLVFYDKARLYFNFNKKSLSFDKSMLLLDNGLYKSYKKAALDSAVLLNLPEVSTTALAGNQSSNRLAVQARQQLAQKGMLENVTVRAKARTPKEMMDEKYVSGLFSGNANSFDLVNDPLAGAYMDIFQYLQGKVAGLQITGNGSNTSLSWRGGTPVLYFNEMQTDISMIASMPVNDIAYIKVFRPGESIVSGGGGGVIAIYTRKGGDVQPSTTAKGLNAVQLMGYSPVKEFYSPDYAMPGERDAADDARITLYWNPAIYMDKGRKHLRFQFYNSDITRRFRLIMEGINAEGKMIHVEKTISK